MKKAPLGDKRRKTIISSVLVLSLFFIIYGIYSFQKIKPADGKKEEVKVETGDRPLKKDLIVYINADGGLSLRENRDQNSKRLVIIPNKTQLTAVEELDGWYKVTYQDKEGWIIKQYTTTDAPAEDPYKDWSAFTGAGFKVKYPLGWKVKDYGANTGKSVTSLVAFSNQELPTSVPEGTEFLAPITFEVSTKTSDEVNASFATISGVTKEQIDAGGRTATKYTYTSAYSNTQMTSIVLSIGSQTLTLSEAGGYQDDLANMVKTLSF
jgi:hypothetical protein